MLHFNKKLLSLAVSAVFSSYCTLVYASDLEIYSNAEEGLVTLFMMLDTSGSMGDAEGYGDSVPSYNRSFIQSRVNTKNGISSLVEDYQVCKFVVGTNRDGRYTISREYDLKEETRKYRIKNNQENTFSIKYCPVNLQNFRQLSAQYQQSVKKECEVSSDSTHYKCYDRLTRLKIALVQLLSSNIIEDKVKIGIGQFPTNDSRNTTANGTSGRVVYPALDLTDQNRQNLIDQVLGLTAFNGTPSAAAYAEAGLYMLGRSPVSNGYVLYNSGFLSSPKSSKTSNELSYKAPIADEERENKCNGTGIYFLTDGFANSSTKTYTQNLMSQALNTSWYLSNLTDISDGGSSRTSAGWPEIGGFAKSLRVDKKIKTAVVGFGSLFPNDHITQKQDLNVEGQPYKTYYDCSKLDSGSVRNTCNWGAKSHPTLSGTGGYGEGGFYSAQSVDDVVQSVNKFVDEVKPVFKPMNTGSPTVPVDTFEPTKFDTSAYYSTLTPTPGNTYQLWLGNLNKYQIIDGVLAGKSGGNLHNSDGSLNENVIGYWTGGVQGSIPLKDGATANSKRKILTNRVINSNSQSQFDYKLNQVTVSSIMDTNGAYKKDPDKGYWLNLLGFKIEPDQENYVQTDLVSAPENRQMGSILHSTPILLNQKSTLDKSNREDYLLFGTTQGLLHVVSANSNNGGQEIFTFVPSEMFNKQKKGFVDKNLTNGELFYGIDGPWTAYSQRKLTNSQTLSVNADGSTTNKNGPELLNKSLQWVYGGLRMGGKSYYALDLTKIASPELKFHIDPENQHVVSLSGNSKEFIYPELSYMGQSWSKPTVAWVNFKGTKRLVMFVGGGYDMEYENKKYIQTNGRGAGVYMFDANSGELLWYVKNDFNKSVATSRGVKSTYNENMKYSIVSDIDAIDRDGDGLIDNLYFGDLAGQVFRVDINNFKESSTFVEQNHIVRLTNQHKDEGLSPRFYDSPTITIHSENGNIFAAVSIASGNRSNPLAEGSESAKDGLYVIYDNDLAQNNLFADGKNLAHDATLLPLSVTNGVPRRNGAAYNGGWYYTFPGDAGHFKAINGLYAFGSLLRVNIFNKDGEGINKDCGAGVKGDTGLMNFCLPTGKCPGSMRSAEFIKVSAGITGTSASMQVVNGKTYISTTAGNKANPTSNGGYDDNGSPTSQGLKQLRWYEQ